MCGWHGDNRQTAENLLTPGQMVKYIEMEIQLAILDELERNRRLGCKGQLEI